MWKRLTLLQSRRASHFVLARQRFYSNETAAAAIAAASSSHVPAHDFAAYNISQYVMDAVNLIHDMTGWNYAGCIVVGTALGRMALFPLVIQKQRVEIKKQQIDKELERFEKTNPTRKALAAQRDALYRYYGYSTWQAALLPVANIGFAIFTWYGLRWMGYYYPDELSTGGILWFVDLTQRDSFYRLPIVSWTCSFVMMEVSGEIKGKRKIFANCFFVPFLVVAPASVNCFWAANSLGSMLQDVIVSQPQVRSKLGIMTASERARESIVIVKEVEKQEVKDELPFKVRKGLSKGKKKKTRKR